MVQGTVSIPLLPRPAYGPDRGLGTGDPGRAGPPSHPASASCIPESVTDQELRDRCVAGDARAWEEFLARFRGTLRKAAAATLVRALGSAAEDDVEAVVETTLMAVVADRHAVLRSWAGRSTLAGFLRAIAARTALNHLRSERRKGWLRFRPLEAAGERELPSTEAADPAELEKVRRALKGLPPRDRLLLEMFHLDGASYREIGAVAGLSINAISPALARARERMREKMKEER